MTNFNSGLGAILVHGHYCYTLLFSDVERHLLNMLLLSMKGMIVVRVASYKLVFSSFCNLGCKNQINGHGARGSVG